MVIIIFFSNCLYCSTIIIKYVSTNRIDYVMIAFFYLLTGKSILYFYYYVYLLYNFYLLHMNNIYMQIFYLQLICNM